MTDTGGGLEARPGDPEGIRLTLTGDRRDVEAMAIEFRRLAKARGLDVGAVRIRSAEEPSGDDEAEGGSGERA